MNKGTRFIDVNSILPLRDVFGRSDENDERQDQTLREVRVRASSELPDELQDRGLENLLYVRVRLRSWELKLTGERFIEAVRRALREEISDENKVMLFAERAIESKKGDKVFGIRRKIDSIKLTGEIVSR